MDRPESKHSIMNVVIIVNVIMATLGLLGSVSVDEILVCLLLIGMYDSPIHYYLQCLLVW